MHNKRVQRTRHKVSGPQNADVHPCMKATAANIQDGMPFEVIGPITADKAAERLWRQGKLQSQWVAQYPELFDERDLGIFLHQHKNHFFEACAAIWWRQHGFCCLVEKYDIKTPKDRHPRKAEVFHKLVGPSQFERWWAAKSANRRTGPPDLFVYKPDFSEWFLCEVKGPTDKVRPPQKAFWLELEQIFNKRVRVLHVAWAGDGDPQ